MICPKCGAQVEDGASVCPVCGEAVTTEVAPAANTDAQLNEESTPAFVLGIIALATSEIGIPGIILGAIGSKKVRDLEEKFGRLDAKGRLGKIFSKIGKIVGIVMTVCWAIIIVFGVLAGVLAAIAEIEGGEV